MTTSESTCWSLIHGAAAGDADDRAGFARRYAPVVRAYLAARWRGSPHVQDLDDVLQEVFVACFEPGGVLSRAEPDRPGGFRAYLYGVVRNVARRVEARRVRGRENQPPSDPGLEQFPADDESLSRVFDRAWAEALLREAARRQAELAERGGPAAVRRVDLLRLRFHDGLPIRDIAARWGEDPAVLHREYAKARREFRDALRDVVAFHQHGAPDVIDRACADLLTLLR
jgi:RNA polymerase sigma-70 factor (ECF subfamily)